MLVHEVNLGEKVKEAEILPLSDFHIGSPSFDKDALKKYLQYVGKHKNRYVLLNGDIINNVTRNSVGNVYSETMSPREQIREAVYYLSPYKSQILGIVSGNHERRTDKESGLSPVEVIADMLEVPYFGSEVLIKLQLGKSRINNYLVTYTIYATHGWGSGRKRGSKVNNLESLKNVVICDVYCTAHTHSMAAFPSLLYIPVPEHKMVREQLMWFVSSGSFQKRGDDYAAQKELEPQPLGCPIISFSGKERKVTVIQGRL